MEKTNKRLLLIALLFASLVGLGIFRFLTSIESMATLKYTDSVVIAVRDIPARSVVRADMVKLEQVPKGQRHLQAVVNLDQVIGKVATQDIVTGEQVLGNRLFASAQQSGLAFQLPNGKRAVSIGINERIAVAYLLRPGDFVDVVLSFEQAVTRESQSAIILQNLEVLAVGSEMKTGARAQTDAQTLTLAVSPEQAERITWAEDYGRIRLLLRPATDHQLVATPGQKASTVAGGR